MKLLITTILLLISISNCFADTALIRKSDGYPIEYQNGDVFLNTFLKNNPQYTSDQVVIVKMTFNKFKGLSYKMIDGTKKKQKAIDNTTAIQSAIDALKAKGFIDTDIDNLKKVLKN